MVPLAPAAAPATRKSGGSSSSSGSSSAVPHWRRPLARGANGGTNGPGRGLDHLKREQRQREQRLRACPRVAPVGPRLALIDEPLGMHLPSALVAQFLALRYAAALPPNPGRRACLRTR